MAALSMEEIKVVLTFCLQILEVIGGFVFSVMGASGVGFRNCKRHWKAGSEGYLMKVIKSAFAHIQFDIFSV